MPKKRSSLQPKNQARRSTSAVGVRNAGDGNEWELVHPRCAIDRAEDMEEVRAMLDAGEFDVARDELVWILGGCHDFMEAHRTLGDLALADEDFSLARGHFGTAYRLATTALKSARRGARLPYTLEANREFYLAGKGLAWSLMLLGKNRLSEEVVGELLRHDPSDPLDVRGLGKSP
ncbi:MAG: hypothetical protein MI757_20410 [Pirellulales bacterium]|nr:hypothetical protein [Pirellulales bacterium]